MQRSLRCQNLKAVWGLTETRPPFRAFSHTDSPFDEAKQLLSVISGTIMALQLYYFKRASGFQIHWKMCGWCDVCTALWIIQEKAEGWGIDCTWVKGPWIRYMFSLLLHTLETFHNANSFLRSLVPANIQSHMKENNTGECRVLSIFFVFVFCKIL